MHSLAFKVYGDWGGGGGDTNALDRISASVWSGRVVYYFMVMSSVPWGIEPLAFTLAL